MQKSLDSSIGGCRRKIVELEDEKLREFGKAGRRLAEEKYSVEKIVGEYINLIEAILSKS